MQGSRSASRFARPGPAAGVGRAKRGAGGRRGPPLSAARVRGGDGSDGAGAPRREDAGRPRIAPRPVGASRARRYGTATPRRGEPVFSAVGCPRRRRGEGRGGSGDVFKCILLYICSLNAYGTGRQSIWALHNN